MSGSTRKKVSLKVDWATHEAARFTCVNWHYSGGVPAGKLVKVGVWEDGRFIGVVLFGRGANHRMSSAYDLEQNEACELVRIALTEHASYVSRIVRLAVMFLRKQSPGLKLIISYADPAQDHHGGIYQAGNWIYAGPSQAQCELVIDGQFMHKRNATARWGTAAPEKIKELTGKTDVKYGPVKWKHIYLMPLTAELREQVSGRSKPYPKRDKQAMAGSTGTAEV